MRLGSTHKKKHKTQFLINSILNDEIKKKSILKDLNKKKSSLDRANLSLMLANKRD